MPRRLRRRYTTIKKRNSRTGTAEQLEVIEKDSDDKSEVTPHGRLKGALKEVLGGDDSDASAEHGHTKRRYTKKRRSPSTSSDDEEGPHNSPQRYILKLFDRSVDLSQFNEDSPLYPICRAWMVNRPKMNYKKIGKNKHKPPEPTDDSVELPGPIGPPVSRIPKLLPEQENRNKDNINLDYDEAPPPPMEMLVATHSARWAAVRRRWLDQANRAESRYDATQKLLNKINSNAI